MDCTFKLKLLAIMASAALITATATSFAKEKIGEVGETLKTKQITGVAEDRIGPRKSVPDKPQQQPAAPKKKENRENKENLEFVRGVYKKLLNRDVDAEGVNTWVNGLNNSEMTKQTVVKGILDSGEYKQKQETYEKSPNASSVKSLFKEVMGRDADRASLAAYTRDLDSGRLTKEEVRQALMESPEYKAKVEGKAAKLPAEVEDNAETRAVGQIIKDLLRREPDAEAINEYAENVKNKKVDITDIIKSIENSEEYKKTSQRLKKIEGSDEEVVKTHYRELLNREPSPAVVQGYVEDIKSGKLNRESVRVAIMLSGEYRQMLMDLPADPGIDSMVAEIEKSEDAISATTDGAGETEAKAVAVQGKAAGKVSFETFGITHQQSAAGRPQEFVFFSMRGGDFKRILIFHCAGQKPDKSPKAVRLCVQCPEFDNTICEAASDNLPQWHKWAVEWGGGSVRFFLDGNQIGKAPFSGHPTKITVGGDELRPESNFLGQWRNLKVE